VNEQELRHILARNPAVTVTDHLGRSDRVSSRTDDRGEVHTTESQPGTPDALDAVATGKKQSVGMPRVSFVFYRSRLLDVDGFRSCEKDLLDGLVKACLLPGDKVGQIILDPPRQEKVAHKWQEETVIRIRYHD
jgi:hypothetical protein